MSRIITEAGLRELAEAWLRDGQAVAGPSEVKLGLIQYRPITAAARLLFDGFVHPANSIKEFFFPRHEPLYRYRLEGSRVVLEDCEPPAVKQLVFARPCDAAALPVLDHVFNWDCADEFYNRRREATTVVTLACSRYDDECFCTSVGLGPAAEQGADAVLFALGGGAFEVRPTTAKGDAAFADRTEESDRTATPFAGPPRRVALPRVEFDSPVWEDATLECLGCGACAYTCPTCHCFDIVDEGNAAGGMRAKNWDSCQFSLFTLHASGHNPRHAQPRRQRQRIYHKFHIYPEKFGPILCTGCGNCARQCPAGLGVLNVLKAIEASHAEHLPA
ncbi:MAG: 4Fe-4S dicluster domain-containing protein [Bryobacteraceae bacterium]|nr:4Fe-4S dicluster domain-containing protein [Bryobacteraceae bacterium]